MVAPRKQTTPNFRKIEHFLPIETHTYVCVSKDKKVLFFGKIWHAFFSCTHRFWDLSLRLILLVVAFGREEVLNTNYRGCPKLEGIVLRIDTYSDAIFILFVKDLIVEQLFQTFKKLAISVCTTGMKWKKLVWNKRGL